MKNLICEFIDSIKADGKSKCTILSYTSDLKDFEKFFVQKKIQDIRYSDLRKWSNYLFEKNLCPETRARKISCIKTFFRYLLDMEIIEKNPASNLKPPKLEKKEPVVITNEEAREILFQARNAGENEITYFRDYTIISMFLYTGIRREELCNISLDDINIEKREILIHGKGAKQRVVYISENLYSILIEYINTYRGRMKRAYDSEFLFPSMKSEKISVKAINNIVNRFFEKAGIKRDRISAHILRKRFATSIFENTNDIALTSQLLGHSSPTVTMRYVDIGKSNKRAAAMSISF